MANKIIRRYEWFSKLCTDCAYIPASACCRVLDLPPHFVNQKNSIQTLKPELKTCLSRLKPCYFSHFCAVHWGDFFGLKLYNVKATWQSSKTD